MMTKEVAIDNLMADIKYWENTSVSTEHLYMAINALEQESKTEWIPVSEKLPEKNVWVLTYCKTKDGYEYQAVLLIDKYRGEWTDNDDFCDEVIAWVPLPKPYKTESEE